MKKGGVLVILGKEVEECNREKQSLGFKSKE